MSKGGTVAAIGIALTLVACGEGGGSRAPTPIGSAMPTPTPSPSPSPVGNAMLSPLVNDQTFVTSSVVLQGNLDRNAHFPGTKSVTGPTAGTILNYKSADQSYAVAVAAPVDGFGDFMATFTAANLVAAQSNVRYAVYQRDLTVNTTDNRKVTLKLFRPGAGNDQLALSYASAGIFSLAYTNAASHTEEYRPFAYFAQTTGSAGVPLTGTATYRGIIVGEAFPTNTPALSPSYDVVGTFTLTVDFATRKYTGTMSLTGTDSTGATLDLGTFPIVQGTVPAFIATFDGTVQSGPLAGSMAGPNAEELGISLRFASTVHIGSSFAAIDIVAAGAAKR